MLFAADHRDSCSACSASLFGGVACRRACGCASASTLVLGAIPFCALGLGLGYFAGPNSAPAIVNLIYLPMAFASGLWIPFEMLPPVVKAIAPFLPPYHLGQLALGAIGAGRGAPAWSHVVALAGFTLVGLGLASGVTGGTKTTWG